MFNFNTFTVFNSSHAEILGLIKIKLLMMVQLLLWTYEIILTGDMKKKMNNWIILLILL